eukprot:jgi/Mesen1/10603/ME000086S10143
MEATEGEGFLTEEQRMVFSAATEGQNSGKEQTGPRPHIEHATKHVPSNAKHHPVVAPKQERKSHSLKNGRPKKGGGGGGKGTWGNPLAAYSEDSRLDRNDPNYDSDELVGAPVAEFLEGYKRKVVGIVEEYFASGDVAAAAADLRDLGSPSLHHHFVKRAISLALDRHDREREMAAELLSALYGDVVPPEQLAKGFASLVESADDLELDCPTAVDTLALHLARAVVDDILPPAFLARTAARLLEGSRGLAAIRAAERHLATPHHAERAERFWGGRAAGSVDGTKDKIKKLLEEYVTSGDQAEALRCIRELQMPFYHHEVVKRALTLALEKKERQSAVLALLKEAADEALITSSQLAKGFTRMSESVEDLSLDVPDAGASFQAIVDRAKSDGWLSVSYALPPAAPGAASAGGGASGAGAGAGAGAGRDAPGGGVGASEEELQGDREYKEKCSGIVREYFASGDVAEVARSLEELGAPERCHLFVKRLVAAAMDRKSREREMASVLLSSLYGEVLSTRHVAAAFDSLLDSVEDLALDIPDAARQLSLFIARAVVDDVLAPLYVSEAAQYYSDATLGDSPADSPAAGGGPEAGGGANGEANGKPSGGQVAAPQDIEANADTTAAGAASDAAAADEDGGEFVGGQLALEVVQMAEVMLDARHAGERILRCFGGTGAGRTVEDTKANMARLLEEFAAGGEMSEACQCLRELDTPFFHHEVVKKALVMAMEKQTDRPLEFLRECSGEGLITTSQMAKGFARTREYLPDLSLDIPDARAKFAAYVALAQGAKWLSSAFSPDDGGAGGDSAGGGAESAGADEPAPAAAKRGGRGREEKDGDTVGEEKGGEMERGGERGS